MEISLKDKQPNKRQSAARLVAETLLNELPLPKSWALFTGDNGRGKTHLLCALVNGCRSGRVWSQYTKSATVLDDLRQSYNDPDGSATLVIRRRYENIPVLIVDELDRVKWTDWAAEQLFAILDARYMAKKATWFGSNLGPSALESLSGTTKALVSRMSSGEIVALNGPDFRPLEQPKMMDRFHE